jgi:asparagine synthase (glutamine-hydrolysing)
MSGIAGIVRFDDQPIHPMRLRAMLTQLRHRGPDGQAITHHGRCALLHAALRVVDPLSAPQPMHLPSSGAAGPLHLVFNGEIYNHRALRRQLEQLGHQFLSDHSDTEVLLLGYRQWGTELPKHLHGMFAFALWDEHEQALLLVRDRAGHKPLYYSISSQQCAFASLVATLVAGCAAPQVRPSALLTFLRLGYPLGASMIDGIEELPPAHWMKVDRHGRSTVQRYWQPPPISRSSTALGAVDALREVLSEAVASRLEADVPLGCFLSGGIDSSLIAAVAQEQLRRLGGDALRTFSVAMPDIHYDESSFAQTVARHIRSQHTVLHADPSNALDDLTRLIAVAGEPMADTSLLSTFRLCQAARQHVAVALSGDGGDELFAGHDRYRALRYLTSHRAWLAMIPSSFLPAGSAQSTGARLRRLAQAAHAGPDPATQYGQIIHLFTEQQIRALGIAAVSDSASTHSTPVPDWPDEPDRVSAAMRWDLTHQLPFQLLRKIDRASMAVALEVRCPLLDTQVCDLAGHLPARVLMPGNRPKGLLRTLAGEYLPASITHRTKGRADIPMGQWFRTHLKEALADHLFAGHLDRLGLARAPVRRYFDEHIDRKADHTHRLFALLQLSLWSHWLRSFAAIPPFRELEPCN